LRACPPVKSRRLTGARRHHRTPSGTIAPAHAYMRRTSKAVAPAPEGNAGPREPDNSSFETLTEDMISDLEVAFRLFDTDGGGTITIKELRQVFETLGQSPSDADLKEMMKEVDRDGSGAIDLEEFCRLMVTRMNSIDDPKLLAQAFTMFDADGSGSISREELKSMMVNVMGGTGENVSEAEIDDVLNEVDKDGDGDISYEEFVKSMTDDQ